MMTGLVVVLIIAGILWLFGFNFGITNEGTVTYSDCRQIINLNQGDWQTYFHNFTCDTLKTEKGVVYGGECVSVVNDHSLFSSSHSCAAAYIYNIKPTPEQTGCTDPAYPYLGYNDKCYSYPQ